MKRQGWLCAIGAAIALTALSAESAPSQRAAEKTPRFGVCDREAQKLVGREAIHVGPTSKIRAPKRLRNVQPVYPSAKQAHTGSGTWMGEALIDTAGKVHRVWTLREPQFTPPWPEFNDSVVSAISQWLYEPTVVEGRPVPVCMTVTVEILWQ